MDGNLVKSYQYLCYLSCCLPVCKRGDDKAPRIPQVLVAIEELCIDSADIQVVVLKPIVSVTYIISVARHMVRMKDERLPKKIKTTAKRIRTRALPTESPEFYRSYGAAQLEYCMLVSCMFFDDRGHSLLRNALGVGGCHISQKKCYEGVQFNIISVTRVRVGVNFPEKKLRNT